jgi:Sensors of blue-light using FAD
MVEAAPDRTVESSAESPDLFRLMYRSHNLIPQPERKAELGTLFSGARSFNKTQGITGALLVSQDWFVQVLEGAEPAVRALFARIEKDPRHDRVAPLETTPIEARVFSRWAMARVSPDGETDIPLIANTSGVVPAAAHETTPEQETVLEAMRAVLTVYG